MNWLNEIINLGINRDLLLQANLDPSEYPSLYEKCVQAIHYWRPSLIINNVSQLLALAGYPDKIINPASFTDNLNNNIAHYAAWSGKKEALEQVNKNHPELMTQNNCLGDSIALYAAWSGKIAALDWVQENYPGLFSFNQNTKRIAFFAAWSGNPAMLDWIEIHYPELLLSQNRLSIEKGAALSGKIEVLEWIDRKCPQLIKDSFYFVYFAAWSGKPEAVKWINAHFPDLLQNVFKEDKTAFIYAAMSGNPDQFNLLHALNGRFKSFYIRNFSKYSKYLHQLDTTLIDKNAIIQVLKTIDKALDNNHSLFEIHFAQLLPKQSITTPSYNRIRWKCLKNQQINSVISNQYFTFFQTQYQKKSTVPHLPSLVLGKILHHSLPRGISPHATVNALIKCKDYSSPKRKILVATIDKEISKLDHRLKNRANRKALFTHFDECGQRFMISKIKRLKGRLLINLQKSVLSNPSMDLKEVFMTWYNEEKKFLPSNKTLRKLSALITLNKFYNLAKNLDKKFDQRSSHSTLTSNKKSSFGAK